MGQLLKILVEKYYILEGTPGTETNYCEKFHPDHSNSLGGVNRQTYRQKDRQTYTDSLDVMLHYMLSWFGRDDCDFPEVTIYGILLKIIASFFTGLMKHSLVNEV